MLADSAPGRGHCRVAPGAFPGSRGRVYRNSTIFLVSTQAGEASW